MLLPPVAWNHVDFAPCCPDFPESAVFRALCALFLQLALRDTSRSRSSFSSAFFRSRLIFPRLCREFIDQAGVEENALKIRFGILSSSRMKETEMSENQILERLLSKFENRQLISVYEAAQEIRPGMTPAAVRTALSKKRFPLPTYKIMGVRMCKIIDLAIFQADPAIQDFSVNSILKRGPGRPRKCV